MKLAPPILLTELAALLLSGIGWRPETRSDYVRRDLKRFSWRDPSR